ncbi:MAG TPA: hypothetical protein VFT70_05855 [Nocardioides sp.]|nr:hypothetical protein [Nocardioides sp.]
MPQPGALLPDVTVDGRRLREAARRGLLVLCNQPIELPEVGVPIVAPRVVAADPAEAWLVRPDAHVAAVGTPAEITSALLAQFG